MRIAILGLGAVGGHICARLCDAGRDVTAIARGATLRALAEDGLELTAGDSILRCRPRLAASLTEAGKHDLVIVAMKATSLEPELAAPLAGIVDPSGAILFLQNGVPWWYPIGREAGRLATLDQTRFADALQAELPVARVFGGVVYSANSVRSPGAIVNNSPDRNAVTFGPAGRPDASRMRLVEEAFSGCGLDVRHEADIRLAVWRKLLLATSMPTLCIAAGATPEDIRSSPALRQTFGAAIDEVARVAAAEGYALAADVDAMLAAMPRHMPSMVTDYLVGRPMELESALTAPRLLAMDRGVATPVLDTLDAVIEGRVRDRLIAGQGICD